MHVAALVDPADVAGDEESVGAELRLGLFRHAPVAGEDVRTAHLENADLPRSENVPFRVGDADLDARERTARPTRVAARRRADSRCS